MYLNRQAPGASLAGLAAFVLGAYSRLISDSFIYPGRRAKVRRHSWSHSSLANVGMQAD
jgi:hypothetical protein